MKNVAYLVTILSVFFTIKFGECVKCYFCDTITDANCAHPEKHKMETKECIPTNLADMKSMVDKLRITKLATFFDVEIDRSDFNAPLSCIKTVSKVNDKDIILRGCQLAPKDNLDVCQKLLTEGKDIVTHCSFCNENGCNSAPFKTASVSLLALLIPVLVVL